MITAEQILLNLFVTPDFPKGRWKIKAITSKTKWIGQGHTEQWNTDPKLNIIISEKYQKVKIFQVRKAIIA